VDQQHAGYRKQNISFRPAITDQYPGEKFSLPFICIKNPLSLYSLGQIMEM
jgi:hypothetical protein